MEINHVLSLNHLKFWDNVKRIFSIELEIKNTPVKSALCLVLHTLGSWQSNVKLLESSFLISDKIFYLSNILKAHLLILLVILRLAYWELNFQKCIHHFFTNRYFTKPFIGCCVFDAFMFRKQFFVRNINSIVTYIISGPFITD